MIEKIKLYYYLICAFINFKRKSNKGEDATRFEIVVSVLTVGLFIFIVYKVGGFY